MTSKNGVIFRHKVYSLQAAVKLHGGHLTIFPDGVYLTKRGETLAKTWEDIGDLLGETWDEITGELKDEQCTDGRLSTQITIVTGCDCNSRR